MHTIRGLAQGMQKVLQIYAAGTKHKHTFVHFLGTNKKNVRAFQGFVLHYGKLTSLFTTTEKVFYNNFHVDFIHDWSWGR